MNVSLKPLSSTYKTPCEEHTVITQPYLSIILNSMRSIISLYVEIRISSEMSCISCFVSPPDQLGKYYKKTSCSDSLTAA